MKENQSTDQDKALSRLLQASKTQAQLPPRFQEGVWRRVACVEDASTPRLWEPFLAWVEKAFARPVLAASYVAVLLFAGLGAGYWQAEGTTAHAQAQWRARYVQTVDPYQMPRN
jgi:hypothetical protein